MQAPPLESQPAEPPTAPTAAASGPLPTLETPYTPDEILRRLDTAARRGRMAGFQPEKPPALFSVEAFAAPFEHKLLATASPGASTRLTFRTVVLHKVLWIYAAVIVFSIWPGTWLTHSMLVSWFPSWYPVEEWKTWAWYLPLLILPLLWLLPKQWKKSRADAHADALAQIGKLARELDATTIT
ncbi:MAG TPA: hypothetical protein VD997_01160 [Phycisphaerales bacterium]|nr:hypothetical protein [Phycisphaerales bacterium]